MRFHHQHPAPKPKASSGEQENLSEKTVLRQFLPLRERSDQATSSRDGSSSPCEGLKPGALRQSRQTQLRRYFETFRIEPPSSSESARAANAVTYPGRTRSPRAAANGAPRLRREADSAIPTPRQVAGSVADLDKAQFLMIITLKERSYKSHHFNRIFQRAVS